MDALSDFLESYLKNWNILFNIIYESKRDSRSLDPEIASKVNNIGINRIAKDHIKLLKLIAVALDKNQSNKCKIANIIIIILQSGKCYRRKFGKRLEKDQKRFYARYIILC